MSLSDDDDHDNDYDHDISVKRHCTGIKEENDNSSSDGSVASDWSNWDNWWHSHQEEEAEDDNDDEEEREEDRHTCYRCHTCICMSQTHREQADDHADGDDARTCDAPGCRLGLCAMCEEEADDAMHRLFSDCRIERCTDTSFLCPNHQDLPTLYPQHAVCSTHANQIQQCNDEACGVTTRFTFHDEVLLWHRHVTSPAERVWHSKNNDDFDGDGDSDSDSDSDSDFGSDVTNCVCGNCVDDDDDDDDE